MQYLKCNALQKKLIVFFLTNFHVNSKASGDNTLYKIWQPVVQMEIPSFNKKYEHIRFSWVVFECFF
jgi:hypothetical protein